MIAERVGSISKPISSRTHAVLDYATIAKLLVMPRLFGAKPAVVRTLTAFGVAKLAYTLLTRHEGGVYRKIPLKTHLAMDAVGGAGLAAVPFILEEENDLVSFSIVMTGLFDIAAAAMTRTEAEFDDDLMYWAGFGPLVEADASATR